MKGKKMSEQETVATEQENQKEEINQEEVVSSADIKDESQFSEVVELSWEEVQETLHLRQIYSENEQVFARFLVDIERRKQAMSSRLSQIETAVYENARLLRENKELNPDWTYEMKLPEKAGEKGYFIKKEE